MSRLPELTLETAPQTVRQMMEAQQATYGVVLNALRLQSRSWLAKTFRSAGKEARHSGCATDDFFWRPPMHTPNWIDWQTRFYRNWHR